MCEKCDKALALVQDEDIIKVKAEVNAEVSKLTSLFENSGIPVARALMIFACAIGELDSSLDDTQNLILKDMASNYMGAALVHVMEAKYKLGITHKERIN